VTQASLPFAGDDEAGKREKVDELTLYCDGGSRGNPGPSAIGAVVYDATTDPPTLIASVSECIGVSTNNIAEYRALIAGLEAVAHLRARVMHVRADSMLVIKQLRGEWKVKHVNMKPLHAEARALLAEYEIADLQHVRREQNTEADALVNQALDAAESF
jgi:ribonuclease HI